MDDEQRVIEFIAANRFPFPGQTDWPTGYRTIANGQRRAMAVPIPGGEVWPDIVILDAQGKACRLGEVDAVIDEAAVARWRIASEIADTMNETGVRNLFVYVPEGLAEEALAALDAEAISFAGLREFSVDEQSVRVTPYLTRGDRYDHQ